MSKAAGHVGSAVTGAAKKSVDFAKKGLSAAGKAVAPVAKVVGKVAKPLSDVAGAVGGAATVGAFFFPPLAAVAGVADAVSLGAGLASTGSKLLDGDEKTKIGWEDAMPLLSVFP